MRCSSWVASMVVAGALLRAAPAGAQLAVGVAGGWTPTTSDVAGAYDTGGHAQASLWAALGRTPLSLRVDLAAHRLPRQTYGGFFSRHLAVYGALAGAEWRLAPAAARVQPYALGSLGTMSTDLGGGREWHLAYGLGLGVRGRVGAVTPYAEVRGLRVQDGSGLALTPVSVGLRF